MDHDPHRAMPASYRHIRLRGLMPCCVESISTSRRLIRPGAQLQCHICQAVLAVDEAGAWCWQEVTFLGDRPAIPKRSAHRGIRSEGQLDLPNRSHGLHVTLQTSWSARRRNITLFLALDQVVLALH
jgi:hypothetical protein